MRQEEFQKDLARYLPSDAFENNMNIKLLNEKLITQKQQLKRSAQSSKLNTTTIQMIKQRRDLEKGTE